MLTKVYAMGPGWAADRSYWGDIGRDVAGLQ